VGDKGRQSCMEEGEGGVLGDSRGFQRGGSNDDLPWLRGGVLQSL